MAAFNTNENSESYIIYSSDQKHFFFLIANWQFGFFFLVEHVHDAYYKYSVPAPVRALLQTREKVMGESVV